MTFGVTLTFRGGKSLTRKTDLVLTFDKHTMAGMYDQYHPVAWRVTSFPAGGGGTFQATYTADLAITRAQVQGGIVQPAGYSTHIDIGQQTILTKLDPIPPETYGFSKPAVWADAGVGQFLCRNQTGAYQNIGVGFYQEGLQDPVTSLVINNVPGNSFVPAEFTARLSAYVVSGYKQTQIIKAQIQSALDWEKNLVDPNLHLSWRLEESGQGYTLVPDSD